MKMPEVSFRKQKVTETREYIYINGERFNLHELDKMLDDLFYGDIYFQDAKYADKLKKLKIINSAGTSYSGATPGPMAKKIEQAIHSYYDREDSKRRKKK